MNYLIIIHILSLLLFLSGWSYSYAHKGVISGYISDSASTQPLSDASVVLTTEQKGTLTDALGHFKIDHLAAGNYEIKISYIGYRTQAFNIIVKENETTTINVVMSVNSFHFSDVVIITDQKSNLNSIGDIDISLRPTNSAQDMLRIVPGLFIAQHAGGGKAEQIFLRGFDCDHGTDINLSVDGMPVNMVSHAHGQGYADLHFVIPELVNKTNFVKGPYYPKFGNFLTAGAVEFTTKNFLDQSMIKLEAGQFNTYRGVALINLFGDNAGSRNRKQSAYIGAEYLYRDAYFNNSQNFNRLNIMAKYMTQINYNTNINISLSSFNSKWDASGQIPDRLVNSGSISRFGTVDKTEGGNTSRKNVNLIITSLLANGAILKNQLFYSNYDFQLFSNFTFFLRDSINGDQIRQKENRNIYGYTGTYSFERTIKNIKVRSVFGGSLRRDDISDISLSATKQRIFLSDFKKGIIDETNASLFIDETFEISHRFTINAGLRGDAFRFSYIDALDSNFTHSVVGKTMINPMLNFIYRPQANIQIYLKTGTGYHSNDTRAIVTAQTSNSLPRALGSDLGTTFKIQDRLVVNTALWMLLLQQEFVYVGDEGIVEPNGKTSRYGLDVSLRYQFTPWLFTDLDLTFCKPQFINAIKEENNIPLAPRVTGTGGITMKLPNGLNGSIRFRFLDHRPANEMNSVIAQGYFLMDATLNYSIKNYQVGFTAENIFNQSWKEAQFDTESRLKGEANPISEIHFTPGTPFFIKLSASFLF